MKGWLEVTYKTRKGLETVLTSAEMSMEEALLLAEDMQRTGRIKEVIFVDYRNSSWSVKEMNKYLKEVETEPHNIKVYFDGNFDRGEKKAGLGCVVYYEQNGRHFRIRKNEPAEGLLSNNESEYAALHLGVRELKALGVQHLPVVFTGDSQVVINQMAGEWACLEEKLNVWADKIDTMLAGQGITPEFELVSRKNNEEADQLASQALKEIEITSSTELT